MEVLNLGVSGNQSEDVLGVLQRFLPELRPDLVIYGVCLNDFLPSNVGEYQSTAYGLPLPAWLMEFVETRSAAARWLGDLYATD